MHRFDVHVGDVLIFGPEDAVSDHGFRIEGDAAQHPLYFGKAVAVIRRKAGEPAPVTLTASADGLAAGSATLR